MVETAKTNSGVAIASFFSSSKGTGKEDAGQLGGWDILSRQNLFPFQSTEKNAASSCSKVILFLLLTPVSVINAGIK